MKTTLETATTMTILSGASVEIKRLTGLLDRNPLYKVESRHLLSGDDYSSVEGPPSGVDDALNDFVYLFEQTLIPLLRQCHQCRGLPERHGGTLAEAAVHNGR